MEISLFYANLLQEALQTAAMKMTSPLPPKIGTAMLEAFITRRSDPGGVG
jgi:hypothetical protein